MPIKCKKSAVFLDRDGVINEVVLGDSGPRSPRSVKDFKIVTDIKSNLIRLKNLGYLLIIITNQPEVSRGLLDSGELKKMHRKLLEQLPVIDDLFLCSHDDDDNCNCRKPKTGMILEAASKWNVDLLHSFFVGDTIRDIQVGQFAGCKTVLIDAPYNQGLNADIRVNDFTGATNYIISQNRGMI